MTIFHKNFEVSCALRLNIVGFVGIRIPNYDKQIITNSQKIHSFLCSFASAGKRNKEKQRETLPQSSSQAQ